MAVLPPLPRGENMWVARRTPRDWLSLAAGMLLLVALSGCTSWRDYVRNGFKVGPNYCPPAAPVADHWIDDRDPNVGSEPANDAAWWQTFNDPVLDSLVQTAYRQNLSLRIAGLRILEARAQRGIAVGKLFPQSQQAFGDYMRTNVSKNTPNADADRCNYDEWTVGHQPRLGTRLLGPVSPGHRVGRRETGRLGRELRRRAGSAAGRSRPAIHELRTAEQRLEYARKNVDDQRESLNLADVKFQQRGDDAARRDPGPIEPVADRGDDPAVGGGPPAGGQPALHPAGHAAAGHRGDARHGGPFPSRPRGSRWAFPPISCGGGPTFAAPNARPPRNARRSASPPPSCIPISRSPASIFFDAGNFKDLFDPRSLGGQRRTDVQLEHPELRPAGEQHPRSGRPLPATGSRVSEHRAPGQRGGRERAGRFPEGPAAVKFLATSADGRRAIAGPGAEPVQRGQDRLQPRVERRATLDPAGRPVGRGARAVAQNLILVYKSIGGGWQIRLGPAPPMQVPGPPAGEVVPTARRDRECPSSAAAGRPRCPPVGCPSVALLHTGSVPVGWPANTLDQVAG